VSQDWMKVEKATPDKPEVHYIARKLNLDPDAVFGRCFRVWSYFDTHTTDGNAKFVDLDWIDAYVKTPGFGKAMAEVGWLDFEEAGTRLPNFDRHNGKTAKDRALKNRRQDKWRGASANGTHVDAEPSTSPSTRGASTSASTREEKIREEKKKEAPPPLPSELDTPEFRAAWDRWQAHRREIRKPLKPTQAAAQLVQLAAWGLARAIAAIDHTVAKGWVGLREPDEGSLFSRAPPNGLHTETPEEMYARQQREMKAKGLLDD
jgi:hypothetical protein